MGRASWARRVLSLWLAVLCLHPAGLGAAQPTIAVVAGADGPSMTFDAGNLRDIFLRRIVIDDAGQALVPVNLPAADPLRVAFSMTLLGKDPAALQRYWNERYFHGMSPPYVVASQEAVLRFVAETPGAIGYVASCQADRRVRVVARLPIPPGLRARIGDSCTPPAAAERAP